MGRISKILLIFFFLAFSFGEIAKDRIIIKLKPNNKFKVYSQYTINDLPDSVKKISQANKLKELKFVGLAPVGSKRINKLAALDRAKADKYFSLVNSEIEKSGLDRVYEIILAEDTDINFLMAQYRELSEVEYVHPVNLVKLHDTVPVDPEYVNQSNALPLIQGAKAWDITTGNSSLTIAVIDTGISKNHEDLKNKLWENNLEKTGLPGIDDDANGYIDDINGWGFFNQISTQNINDDHGHGTHVSGIAAAQTSNNVGIAGVDWKAKIMVLKAFNASGQSYNTDIYKALNYAINNQADVINMSFGDSVYDNTLESYCNIAYNAGILLVASVGNDYNDVVNYPAGFNSVIGVAATDGSDNHAPFSNTNYSVELSAPGVNVLSTITANIKYKRMSGTSMSAPHVSGLCSLMKAKYPDLRNDEIRLALHNGADDLGPEVGYDKEYGFGRINSYNSLRLASTYVSRSAASLTDVYNFPNPVTDGSTRFSFKTDKNIKSAKFLVYDLKGRLLITLDAGPGMAGTYVTGSWDCEDTAGNKLANGTYIYAVEAEDGNGQLSRAKGKLTIVQ